jgi:hypothetical protein
MLNRLSSAVKRQPPWRSPCRVLSSFTKLLCHMINEPPNTSCSIGDAHRSHRIPALTFMHSTIQISQNWECPRPFHYAHGAA